MRMNVHHEKNCFIFPKIFYTVYDHKTALKSDSKGLKFEKHEGFQTVCWQINGR